MKLYEVTQVSDYQSITIDSEDPFVFLKMLKCDGTSKKDIWQSECGFRMIDLSYPEASFPNFTLGALGCNMERIPTEIIEVMKRDGEFLDISIENIKCFNVTNIVDCVDREKTQWSPVPDGGEPYTFDKVVFNLDTTPKNKLFHLPRWTSKIFYLVDETHSNYDNSFYALYKKHNLTGVDFENI